MDKKESENEDEHWKDQVYNNKTGNTNGSRRIICKEEQIKQGTT